MMEMKAARALALSSALAFALSGAAFAQRSGYGRQVSLPQGTVIRAELNDRLSSTDNRPGDRFTGSIRSDRDSAGLPTGTDIIGRVVSVRQATDREPGQVDVEFTALRTPDGRNYPIDGRLTSLDSDSVRRTSDGRLESRGRSSSNKYKFLGYGAGAGAIIGALTGGNLLKGALLGALGGYVYQQLNKDKASNGRYSEVNLKQGTEFGVRVDRGTTVTLADNAYGGSYGTRTSRTDDRYNGPYTDRTNAPYNDRYNDRYDGRNRPYDQRTAGSFEQYGSDIRVMVNGQDVRFSDSRPFMSSGHVMVPLAPVLDAAGFRYNYDPRYSEVTVYGERGDSRLVLGDTYARVNGERVRVDAPAQRINGVLFVPVDFLEASTGLRSDWNSSDRTLRITTRDRFGFDNGLRAR